MRSYKVAARQAATVDDGLPFQMEYVDDDGQDQVEVFTTYGTLSALTMSEFATYVDVEADEVTPGVVAIVANTLAEIFDDKAECARFFKFCRRHRVEDDTLVAVVTGLVEDVVGRPTGRSSSSSAGPSPTGATSRVASSSPASPGRPEGRQVHPDFEVIEGTGGLEASSG